MCSARKASLWGLPSSPLLSPTFTPPTNVQRYQQGQWRCRGGHHSRSDGPHPPRGGLPRPGHHRRYLRGFDGCHHAGAWANRERAQHSARRAGEDPGALRGYHRRHNHSHADDVLILVGIATTLHIPITPNMFLLGLCETACPLVGRVATNTSSFPLRVHCGRWRRSRRRL